MGDVTLRTALAHSLNNVTVQLAQQVGYENVVAMAQRAGLNKAIQATPSVALGAYETTPLEIAGAYTMFANQGMRVSPATISLARAPDGTVLYQHQPEGHAALDPRVAYLMVSTWRFYSFKEIHFNTRQPFRVMLLLAAIFVSIWFWSRWVLFGIALIYMFSGVWWRLQWIIRRRPSPPPPPVYKEASQPS
jgi:hypothetical protein